MTQVFISKDNNGAELFMAKGKLLSLVVLSWRNSWSIRRLTLGLLGQGSGVSIEYFCPAYKRQRVGELCKETRYVHSAHLKKREPSS